MPRCVEFIVMGTPVSAQTKARRRKQQWIDAVRDAARAELVAGFEPWAAAVAVTITHYFTAASMDVDNLPKPILDGIKALVVKDDAQVVELIVRKRVIANARSFRDPSPILAGALAAQAEFVHILVEEIAPMGDDA
jgi:hypothetical protein